MDPGNPNHARIKSELRKQQYTVTLSDWNHLAQVIVIWQIPKFLCYCTVIALFVFEGNFQVQAPQGLYSERRFNGGFFALRVWGAYIWRGLFSEFYGIFQTRPVSCSVKQWTDSRCHHFLTFFGCFLLIYNYKAVSLLSGLYCRSFRTEISSLFLDFLLEDITIFPSCIVVRLNYQRPNSSAWLITKCRRGGNTRVQERYIKYSSIFRLNCIDRTIEFYGLATDALLRSKILLSV